MYKPQPKSKIILSDEYTPTYRLTFILPNGVIYHPGVFLLPWFDNYGGYKKILELIGQKFCQEYDGEEILWLRWIVFEWQIINRYMANYHPEHQNIFFCYLEKIETSYILILTSVICWFYHTDQKCQKNQCSKINCWS